MLSLSLALPTLLFVGVLLWTYASSEQRRVEQEARGLSRGFAVALDREIYGVLTTLQALATSPSLQARDFPAFYKQATEVSRLQGINISLRDLTGHAVLTTRAPFGADIGVPVILAETDQVVLRTNAPVVSNIFKSSVSGRPVFQIVAAPVAVEGAPTYVLGASIDITYLANAIRREHLPEGWVGAFIDRNGIFVARTELQEEMAGKLTSNDYRARAVSESGSYYGRNSQGREVLVGFAKSTLTGWTAAASLSTQAVHAPLNRTLLTLLELGLFLAFLAVGSAWIAGHRLAMAFGRLGQAVTAIGQGRSIEVVVTPVAEINRVGEALRLAAQQLSDRSRERDDAEKALRDREEQLRKLNETLEEQVIDRTRERNRLWEWTNDLVGAGGFDGYLKAINPAWTKTLGWTEGELLARPFVEFVDSADRASLIEAITALNAGDHLAGYVNRILAKNGTPRTIMWSAVPVPDENIFYLVGRDLTEQRLAEDSLRQAQKMEAIGQLTGGIAHDFNNMLAVIIGALNLLQRRLARGDVNVAKYIDGALEGATRAAALTHRLLAFSRQQPLAPEAIDANRMVADMTELLSRALGEQNSVETVLSAGLWKAKADPNQLESVILNLAVNARDAMADGGRLTIETSNAHIDGDYAQDNEIAVGQYVLIAITDTGTGMTPDVIAKAFEPFFTTKGVGKGTGLGLSQVFGFARQSGGHVKIYSEVDHGTTIKLYLPRFYGDALPIVAKKASGPVQGGHAREIILVVEDEDRVRNSTVEVLRDLGYTVLHASSGVEAMKVIATDQDLSLLFTDIVMPGMTGRQLVDAAALHRPHLKVLYTTGYSRNAVVHNGVLDAGTNLLVKPFGIDQLAATVRGVLDA